MTLEKRVTYKADAAYSSLNILSDKTKNVWIVFHGMGYLSRYFLKYFSELDPEENYFIAPQAPSKYYLEPDYKHVGASWLTREDTIAETRNVLAYVNAVWELEDIPTDKRLIILGYSQGVSIATRWMSWAKIRCSDLILHSGGIPVELVASDFDYLGPDSTVWYHYGLQDPYIPQERIALEKQKANTLFHDRLRLSNFDGPHEFDKKFLQFFMQN
jgi:predicted esterase